MGLKLPRADHDSEVSWGQVLGILAFSYLLFGVGGYYMSMAINWMFGRGGDAARDDAIGMAAFSLAFGGSLMTILGLMLRFLPGPERRRREGRQWIRDQIREHRDRDPEDDLGDVLRVDAPNSPN